MGNEISRSSSPTRSKPQAAQTTSSASTEETRTFSTTSSVTEGNNLTTVDTKYSTSSSLSSPTSASSNKDKEKDKSSSKSFRFNRLRKSSTHNKADVDTNRADIANKESCKRSKKAAKQNNHLSVPGHLFQFRKTDSAQSYRFPSLLDYKLKKCESLHYVFKELLNGDYVSPVQNVLQAGGARVLEVGCGKATWAIDMATQYPRSEFIGVDSKAPKSIEDLDPALNIKQLPGNVSFEEHDVKNLPYADESFDFVFCRMQGLVIPGGLNVWKDMVTEMARVCKTDGYVEIVDPNFSPYNEGPRYRLWCDIIGEFLHARGFDPNHGRKLGTFIDNYSLTDTQYDYVSCPIGWSGPIGEEIFETLCKFMSSTRLYSEPRLKLEPRADGKEFEHFKSELFKECAENESFYNLCYAYGKKAARDYD